MVRPGVFATTISMATAEQRMSVKDFTQAVSVASKVVMSKAAVTDILIHANSMQARDFVNLGIPACLITKPLTTTKRKRLNLKT